MAHKEALSTKIAEVSMAVILAIGALGFTQKAAAEISPPPFNPSNTNCQPFGGNQYCFVDPAPNWGLPNLNLIFSKEQFNWTPTGNNFRNVFTRGTPTPTFTPTPTPIPIPTPTRPR